MPKDFKFFAKVAKFCQIWSHWTSLSLSGFSLQIEVNNLLQNVI